MEQPLPTAGGKAGEDGKQNKTGRKHGTQKFIAGWSSPVARQAHNLKAAGSNPAPATKSTKPRGIHHGVLAFRQPLKLPSAQKSDKPACLSYQTVRLSKEDNGEPRPVAARRSQHIRDNRTATKHETRRQRNRRLNIRYQSSD